MVPFIPPRLGDAPGASFHRNSEQQPPGETLPGCSAVHPCPLVDVGVHGQLNPHSFPGTAPRVGVGEHSGKMKGTRERGRAPRDLTLPGPSSPPAEEAPAPPTEGPACLRAAPPPPCLCACRGAEEELAKVLG